jgi:hypothetical protein
MFTHHLARLKQELDGPRLSHRRSTLGIAVASAVLGSFEDSPSGSGRRGEADRRTAATPEQAASA